MTDILNQLLVSVVEVETTASCIGQCLLVSYSSVEGGGTAGKLGWSQLGCKLHLAG